MTRVTLYTREGCHLCDDARGIIRAVGADLLFDYDEVHIAPGDGAYEKYNLKIPVVEINGHPAFYARVNEKRFRTLLHEAEGAA
jgi:glutaredoxin